MIMIQYFNSNALSTYFLSFHLGYYPDKYNIPSVLLEIAGRKNDFWATLGKLSLIPNTFD